jgi:hypothetical protein
MNLLIPYVYLYGHPDPLFEEFTYGDTGRGARKLKNDLKEGDYIFLHTSVGGRKYITAYYVVYRILDIAKAIENKNITMKYKNPHILEFLSGKRNNQDDDVIVFGDPITSRFLRKPLLFDKNLAEKLSLNIRFLKGKTETQSIGSATRAWRELTESDVEIILEAIKSSDREGIGIETILSTDEVTEIIEKDLEFFIERNPNLIGEALKTKRRQLDTPAGRIDLLFEDRNGNLIVVELKLNKIGRDAINQLRRYINWLENETKKDVTGVIVCKGIMPAFEEDLTKLKDIKILRYGWQLKVYGEEIE